VTDALRDALGEFPDDVAPDLAVVEETAAAEHTRLTVEYAVEPGERVRAYLLVPDDAPDPAPGVLAIHQHAGQFHLGKSEPAGLSANAEYHYGLDLCRRGYVVLCPDLLCFEERRPPEYEREEGTAPAGQEYEKFEAMDRLLRDSTLQAKYLSDLSVGLDVLGEWDGVDADRVGTVGHSLGGQEALWLAWYDDRVAAAVSSCGASRYGQIQRDRITHNFASYVPGLLAHGDVEDLLADVAPRPLLVTNGDEDGIFPLDGVEQLADRVSEAYADAGHPERFESVVFEGGHGFPPAVRKRAYDWLDRWLGE
jgi:dienelactone hydrolase